MPKCQTRRPFERHDDGSDMNIDTLSNVQTLKSDQQPAGTIRNMIPKAMSSRGVSVDYVPSASKSWYVFRASYGREIKAADFLIEDGTYSYVACRTVKKRIDGKNKRVTESLLPNLLFAYTTPYDAERYVRHTSALSYISYYYNHFEQCGSDRNPPLTIASSEMENFIRATCSKNEHLMMVTQSQCHFKGGELVIVTEGAFKGVVGKVARVSGQQRVVLTLNNVGLVATAYIPSSFIRTV